MTANPTISLQGLPSEDIAIRILQHFNHSTEAVLFLDTDWRCIYSNQAAANLLGLSTEFLNGNVLWDALPELRESILRFRLSTVLSDQTVLDTVIELPTTNQYLVVHGLPSPEGIFVLFSDASEVRATEQVIAAQERGAFIASVSHDLKNPLGAIRAQAQLLHRRLRRGTTTPESISDGLSLIDASITRMAGQLDELLDVTQLEAGQALALNRTPTDLVKLVRESVAEYQSSARNNQIIVESAFPEMVGNWDEIRLQRVVENLLTNAIKYSPNGGPITFAIDYDESGDMVLARLVVRDQGLGIPERDLPYIFERYHRGANVRGIAGTGIGLAASRLIVQQHGGTIWVTSAEHQGSTFTVVLPLS